MKNPHWKVQWRTRTFVERKTLFHAGENSNSHQCLCWRCKCVCQRPSSPTLSQLPGRCCSARTDRRRHSPRSLVRTGWVQRGKPCVCARKLEAQSCAGWERGQSGSRYCSSRQNRPYHCHHLSCCTGRNSDTGCKVTLYASVWAPEPSPGTWYCCSTSSSGGHRE